MSGENGSFPYTAPPQSQSCLIIELISFDLVLHIIEVGAPSAHTIL